MPLESNLLITTPAEHEITGALQDIARYLSYHPEWDIEDRQIKNYLNNPNQFSFPVHFREGLIISDHSADQALNDLKDCFSSTLRQQILREKWSAPERASNLGYFLDSMNQSAEQHTVLMVKDLSTARSIEAGRFVHRLTLSLPDDDQITIFAKGHGLPENCPLLKFPGWNNRPNMHLYETFFWQIAGITGLVERNAGFFPEIQDPCCIGYTLVEHIPGESSDHLLEEKDGSMTLRPEFFRSIPLLLTQLARWSALNELLRGGDRRTIHLNAGYHRPTNYLIALHGTDPVITGIDHELLFCKTPCISYDRHHKAHEAAIIEALPKAAQHLGRQIFTRIFLQSWKEFTRPEVIDQMRMQIERHFGRSSEESKVFENSIKRNPRDILGELFNQKKEDFV